MAKVGDIIEGKYEILKQIGKGGMSVVYLAMDNRLNKQWAVKEIYKTGSGKNNEVIINSLLSEANLMKKLDHPALPRIVDIIDNDVTIYVVMDYIEGESLDKVLLQYGPQAEEIVVEWAKQLCDALSYLHMQKPPIIYRDMKPANVMMKPEGNLKVIDFGIAREYKELNLADTTVLGTKGYAPPEQHGSRQTDERSDIYALGMTLHHLLTGVDPRPADYMYASVRQWNPNISDGVEAIIDKCTALDPKNRYQNCAELMYDLEHPDLITKGFKQMQKNKLNAFRGSIALFVVMLLVGIGCKVGAVQVNTDNYEQLISLVDSTDLDSKIASYKEAIEIYPYDMRAYSNMLDAYEIEGEFNKDGNDEFLALYNKNSSGFDTSEADVASLNYKIGLMYFNYYTGDDGVASFSNRIQKAMPFFTANYENANISDEFEEKELSDCYYHICSFYKTYILSTVTVEEASKDDYLELFTVIESALDVVEEAGAYDQLTLYNSVFMLLYDQRASMESVGVEQSEIDTLLDEVYNRASDLTVQKEQSQELQNEILDNYDEYKAAIERTYSNAEVRE